MKTLYPELIDYIYQNCGEHFSEIEKLAINHNLATIKFKDWPEKLHPKLDKIREDNLTKNKEALALLKNGTNEFIINTATRIYNEYKHQIYFNLCPRCNKIARTPKAKQCRFCSYDWH